MITAATTRRETVRKITASTNCPLAYKAADAAMNTTSLSMVRIEMN
ncbi:hypothetical protein [Cytobacillus massiliigabonensis]|nr:hypothetical protein [Cytobacillus massiliigabonensis]